MILGLFNALRFVRLFLPSLSIKVNLRIAMLGENTLVSHFTPQIRVVNMNWESQSVAQVRRKIQWRNNKTISKLLEISEELVRKGWTINISMYKFSDYKNRQLLMCFSSNKLKKKYQSSWSVVLSHRTQKLYLLIKLFVCFLSCEEAWKLKWNDHS